MNPPGGGGGANMSLPTIVWVNRDNLMLLIAAGASTLPPTLVCLVLGASNLLASSTLPHLWQKMKALQVWLHLGVGLRGIYHETSVRETLLVIQLSDSLFQQLKPLPADGFETIPLLLGCEEDYSHVLFHTNVGPHLGSCHYQTLHGLYRLQSILQAKVAFPRIDCMACLHHLLTPMALNLLTDFHPVWDTVLPDVPNIFL